MQRRKSVPEIPEGQLQLFSGADKSAPLSYADKPFLPECSIRTTFGELSVGDKVDYWGNIPLEIVLHVSNDGRTSIKARCATHQQCALGPDTEVIWRMPRAGE